VGMACAPVVYAVTKTFERISGKWEARCNDTREAIGGIFSETFMDIHTVRALTLESYFHKRHHAANSKALVLGFRRACYSGVFFGLSDSSLTFVYCKLSCPFAWEFWGLTSIHSPGLLLWSSSGNVAGELNE